MVHTCISAGHGNHVPKSSLHSLSWMGVLSLQVGIIGMTRRKRKRHVFVNTVAQGRAATRPIGCLGWPSWLMHRLHSSSVSILLIHNILGSPHNTWFLFRMSRFHYRHSSFTLMSFSFFSIRAKGVSVGDYIFPAPFAVALDFYLNILQPLYKFVCFRVLLLACAHLSSALGWDGTRRDEKTI